VKVPVDRFGAFGEDGYEAAVVVDDGKVDRQSVGTAKARTALFTGFSQLRRGAAPRCGKLPPVKRTAATLLAIWAMMLVAAPAALADEGVGLAGEVTDKTITFFCFGVIAFFAALVIVLSLIQNKLEKRKEQRRSDLARFN
jgi:hypothetical protein